MDAGTGLLPLQRSCADFFASLCEVPADQAPGSCALAGILLLEDAGGVVADRIAPSIPGKMVSSVRDPGAPLTRGGGGGYRPRSRTRRTLGRLFFSSTVFRCLPVEEVFEQFCGAVLGRLGGGIEGKGGQERGARPSPTAGGPVPAWSLVSSRGPCRS